MQAINDRPHGSSLRLWRSRVRDVTRGGDHDAPSARGTEGRALLRRNPRMVPMSLEFRSVSIGADRRDCPEGELASGERSLVLRRAGQMTLGRS